jgi:SecD/SecF fusion protein
VSGYFDRIEQQLVERVEATAPRRARLRPRLSFVAPAVSVAVALIVVIVFLSVPGARSPSAGSGGRVELVYQAEPTAQTPVVTRSALDRTIEVMRERAAALGAPPISVTVRGTDGITVRMASSRHLARVEQQLATSAQLYFYDWEANVLLPSGHPVASQLLAQNPQAVTISRGAGEPDDGSTTLYNAVKLAARQPESTGGSQPTGQYYLFGRAGTSACAAAAKFYGVPQALAPQHCLLAGPDDSSAPLRQSLPPGVTPYDGQTFEVKPGTVVLQAVTPSFSDVPNPASPSTQFYVLKDDVALDGAAITNPRESTDAGGNPAVDFGFTHDGARAFTNVTAAIARRGNEVSGAGTKLEQHFAVALDGVLVTVPEIDSTVYPDGVSARQGAEITGGFTIASARAFATELRFGPLPLRLSLISQRPSG